MNNKVKKIFVSVLSIMMLYSSVFSSESNVKAETLTAVTKYATYNSKTVKMGCSFQTRGTIIQGSIGYVKNIYLYARPSGTYKSGTKTIAMWPKKAVSGVGNYASTIVCLSGKAFISARCQYKYGKSSSNCTSNEIKTFYL